MYISPIDAEELKKEMYHLADEVKSEYLHVDAIVHLIDDAAPVDAIPIDWINLFDSTPIGGDSIGDMVAEWRYQQEVEAERERDEDGNEVD